MKKKLLPFILGLSMIAATPLVAHAVDTPEEDSGNVTYGEFTSTTDQQEAETPVVTAIPECTMTIPRDTTIKRNTLGANIGRVTIDGKYFVKPYYVEVSATKNDFVKVDDSTGNVIANPKANQDIIFDVATLSNSENHYAPNINDAAVDNKNFVQSGTINHTASGDDMLSSFTATHACRRFWKNEAETGDNVAKPYKNGEVCAITGKEDIWLRIGETQWKGEDGANNAKTKPVGGQYKGSITFTATFRDNYIDDMADWAASPITNNPTNP